MLTKIIYGLLKDEDDKDMQSILLITIVFSMMLDIILIIPEIIAFIIRHFILKNEQDKDE